MGDGDAYRRIVSALEARGTVKGAGQGRVVAQCPAHNDGNPSLSVRGIEAQALVHCFAGCDTRDVMAAMEMTLADLYDERRAEYRYESGRVVHRGYDHAGRKKFRQSGDLRKVELYHLDRLRQAGSGAVFLVEGEKDVHAIEAVDGIATTAPMGAANIGKCDLSPLHGRAVVAIADRDLPGLTWAQQVRDLLDGKAASLRFGQAREGNDPADHIGAGLGLTDWEPLEVPAAEPEPMDLDPEDDLLAGLRDGVWLDQQRFPPIEYAVAEIIPEGLTLLVGPPKIGKSWLILGMLLAVAAGGAALGAIRNGGPRRVLYLALEDGDRRMQDRCRQLLNRTGSFNDPIPPLYTYLTRVEPNAIIHTIEEYLGRFPDTALAVIDTLGKVMPQALPQETMYQRDYRIGGRLKAVADSRPGLALVVIHHDRKAGADDFVERVSGSHGLAGAADTVIVLSRDRQSVDGMLQVTGRDIPEGEYALTLSGMGTWALDGADLPEAAQRVKERRVTAGLGDRAAEIIAYVIAQPNPVTPNAVAQALGMDNDDAGKYLRRAAEVGRIRKVARGLFAGPDLETPVRSVRTSETDDTPFGQPFGHPSDSPPTLTSPSDASDTTFSSSVRESVGGGWCRCGRPLLHTRSIAAGLCEACRLAEHEREAGS